MGVPSALEECDILFCDTEFQAPDGHGGATKIQPLFCTSCGKAWVPTATNGKSAEGFWSWAQKFFKASDVGGAKCPFCNANSGFRFDSPQAGQLVDQRRTEWFEEHPVDADAPTEHSFIFRSGYEAHTLAEFLAYTAEHWDEASWHFAEGHMDDWLRAIGHKEIAAIFRESRRLLGDQQAAFERCRTLLGQYGVLE
jgi:hypothetical protein